MSLLISGSLAYDYIMDFPDTFRNHILPEQLHILNVCFVVEKLEKKFGGTAGNIAYNTKLLGNSPHVLCPLGSDGKQYIERFQKLGISTENMPLSKKVLSSSAYITTDKENNQVTAFFPGALIEAKNLSIDDVKSEISFAILSPNQKEATLKYAKECHDKKIPFCFDPGQQITTFNKQELLMLLGQADFFIVNDYELKLTEEKTGLDTKGMMEYVDVLITTLGEKGSIIKTREQTFEIKPCSVTSVEDPTGAGDAYRAGFFVGHLQGFDYETCGQMGSVVAAYAVEHYGTQGHTFTKEEFIKRYKDTYERELNLAL